MIFNEVLELVINFLDDEEFTATDLYLKYIYEHAVIGDKQYELLYWLRLFKEQRTEVRWDNIFITSIQLNLPIYRGLTINEPLHIYLGDKKFTI